MHRLLSLLALSLLSLSCSPTILVKKDDLRKIPKGSTKVIAETNMSPDDAYSYISKSFAKSGCPVVGSKESMQVICNGKAVEGGTMLKALAFIEPTATGSNVVFSGEWGLSSSGQIFLTSMTRVGGVSSSEKIVWQGVYNTKPCIAFQHLVVMAIDVPSDRIRYEK